MPYLFFFTTKWHCRMGLFERLAGWARSVKAQLLTLWFASKDPRTPLLVKVLAVSVVAYAFSPIDLVPDFIPILGYLDDVIIVPLGIALCLRWIPPEVLADSRVRAERWLAESHRKPRNYAAAVVFVAIWIALAYAVWRLLSA